MARRSASDIRQITAPSHNPIFRMFVFGEIAGDGRWDLAGFAHVTMPAE
ncbi:hypothetical protein EDD30_0321 [Couchioplanes caeruleus]|uniref:Uncharacterized protein n=1 Tax=Couchioplanes caeruleus TaxID=56438 RepID=A0A3N1GBN5_9ACTN|nr:hypothetical protein EDD30_0321 [Couchioplanes caeruleus]